MQIDNDVLRVGLDPETGGFTSIYDKRLRREYIGAPDRALLFRLMTPDGEFTAGHEDAHKADISVSGATATIVYSLSGIEAIVTLRLEEDAIAATLTLTNRGSLNIEEVMFPWVRGLAPQPGGQIVLPLFWRRKYADPFGKDLGGDHHTWNEWTQKMDARYPAHLASAWCDYGNAEGGIALEGRHTDFSIMDFNGSKCVDKTCDPVRRTLDLCTVHPRRLKPGETYVSSAVRIFVHPSDWHAVADAHRAWLETWVRKPDRPAKFAEAIGWHFYFMKHQDGYEPHSYADLPAMAEAALAAGCPYLLAFGWQTGGHDNNYMYRYVANEDWGGAQALREGVERCRALGVEIMPFFNGTLANIGMPEHQEFGRRWEAKTWVGHPLHAGDWARHNFGAITRNRAMLHHEIAPCAEHRAYFLETVKRIVQDYGFGNIQLDQIAEKMFPDYNEDHIQTTPDRVYVDGLADLLSKTRALIREVNPDGVMISECFNDFTGQWCDSSWDWTALLDFPEPILYTLPWLMASLEIDALEYAEANRAFAYKMHLDMKIDGGDAPITKYPKFAEYIRRHADLRRKVADYYVYGDFRDQEGVTVPADEGTLVKVYHHRAAGKVGIVVAELKGAEASVTLSTSWPAAGTRIRVCSSAGTEEVLTPAPTIAVSLKPYEVRVLCIDVA